MVPIPSSSSVLNSYKKRPTALAGKKVSRRHAQTGVAEFHKALASAFAASRAAPGAMCSASAAPSAAPGSTCPAPVLPMPPPGLSFSLRPQAPSSRVRGAAKRKRGSLRNMLVQMVGQTPQMSSGGTQTEVPVLHQLLGSKAAVPDSFSMANMLGGSGGAVSVTPAVSVTSAAPVDPSRSAPVTDPSVVDRLKRLGTVIEVEDDPNPPPEKEPPAPQPSALKMLEKMTIDPPQSPVVSALDDRPLFLGKDISVYAKKKGTSFIHPSPNAPLSIIPVGGPMTPPVIPTPPVTVEPKATPQAKVQSPGKTPKAPPKPSPHPQPTVPHLPLLTITKATSKPSLPVPDPIVTTQILPPPIVTVTKTTSVSTVDQALDQEIRSSEKPRENATEPVQDYVPLPFLEPVILLDEEDSPLSPHGTYIFKHDNCHSVELPNDQKVFSCDICSAAFHHLHMLRKHYFRLHVARKYISEKDLEAYNIDPEKADDSNDENIYRCHTCRQCLPTKAELKSHLTDHPPVTDLNKHIKGAKDYRCERCNTHFKWRKLYGKHRKSCRAPLSAKPTENVEVPQSVPEKEVLNVQPDLVSDESPSKEEPITAVTELALRQVIDTRAVRNLQRSVKASQQPKPKRKTRQSVAMAIHSPPEAPVVDETPEMQGPPAELPKPERIETPETKDLQAESPIPEVTEAPKTQNPVAELPIPEVIETAETQNPPAGLPISEVVKIPETQDPPAESPIAEEQNDKTEVNPTCALSSDERLVPKEPTLPKVPETSPEEEAETESTASLNESTTTLPKVNEVQEVMEALPSKQVETSSNEQTETPEELTPEAGEVESKEEVAAEVEPPVNAATDDAVDLERKSDDMDIISETVCDVNEVVGDHSVTKDSTAVVPEVPVEEAESVAGSVDSAVLNSLGVAKNENAASSALPPVVPEKVDLKGFYHCLYCNETFNNGNKKRNHTLSQHPYVRRNHPCVFCKSSATFFKTNVELFQHLLAVHSTVYFACQCCKERFYNIGDLKDHSSKRHTLDSSEQKELDDRKSEVTEEAPSFTCAACQRIWLFKSCFLDHKCNPEKEKSNNPDKATRLPKLRKVKSMDRSDRLDKPMRVDPETMFYSQVSFNVRNNLLHFLDGKLPQDEDDEEVEDESASKAPERNMLSFSAGFPGSGVQLVPEPEPYSRVKAQWEKYNFPKNYDGRCGLTSYIKDMSYLDISTQLIMRRNLQRLQGDPEVTSPMTADDVPSVLALERLATQCAESFGINGIPGGDGETTLGELSGEWVRDRIYVCSVCKWETPCLWSMEDHKYEVHPQVLCPQHELVGDQRSLANTIYKRVFPVEEIPFSPEKPNLRSTPVTKVPCTKCGMDGFSSRPELHIHVLACAGEPIPQWAPTPRKKRWKKRRRPRRGLKRNIPSTPHRPIKVRTKPGDTDTIQKMIANLPAKRSTRRVIGFDEADLKTRSQSTIQNGPVLLPSSRLVLPPSVAPHHKFPKPSSKGSPRSSKDILLAPPPHVPKGTDLIDTSAERGDVLSSLRMMPVSTPRQELLEPRQIIDKVINQKVLGVQNEEASGHSCTGCGLTSDSRNSLRKHQKVCAYFRECGPNAEHKCKACARLFDSLMALIEHSCDEMPKLEIEKDLSPVNSAEIPVLSPVDSKKGESEAAKSSQICGVSFVNGKISYETVESIKMSDEGETNLKRKRSHSLGDIPSGKKMFRAGHRRSARLGQAESGPIEAPEATVKSEVTAENGAPQDEDMYESAPEARLGAGKNKTKKLPTRAERSRNDCVKKPDINRQVLEIKAMEQSLSKAALSPSVESESFLDDDSLWEKQAVVAISEDETTKTDGFDNKIKPGESSEKAVDLESEKLKLAGNETKPKLKRRKNKNLRFATKKGKRKGNPPIKPVSSLNSNKNPKPPVEDSETKVEEAVDDIKIEEEIKSEELKDLNSSKPEVTVSEGVGGLKKKNKSIKKGSPKGATSSVADSKLADLVEGEPQDESGKSAGKGKKAKISKVLVNSKIVVRFKGKVGKQGVKGKGLKIKLPKTSNKQTKQKDLLSYLDRTPPTAKETLDELTGLQESNTSKDAEDNLNMSIDAVVNGTAETLVSVMKTKDLSCLFNLPVEEMAKVMEIGSMEETYDNNSDLIDGAKVNSETVDVNKNATSNKKKESNSKKKKKTSVHNAETVEKSPIPTRSEVAAQEEQKSLYVDHTQSSDKQIDEPAVASESIVDDKPNAIKKKDSKAKKKKSVPVTEQEIGVESHIVLKSEVVSLETKETIEVEKLPAKKGSKKQNKKKSISTSEETSIVQNIVEGGTAQRKKGKQLSVPVEEPVEPNEVAKESVADIAVDQAKESVVECEEQMPPRESNKISEDKVEEDDKQGSKKRGKKGGKPAQTVKVEKKDESVEVEKPILRRRSGKSSLMAELMEEALLGLDSELYQDELPVRTTRSKRSSQKQVGEAEKSQELGEQDVSEISGEKDEEIVPRVTRRQNKKDVAEVSEECTAEPKKLDEIEPPSVVVENTETSDEVVKSVDDPLIKRLPPAKSKKPGQKSGNKKKSIETAIDEDVNKVSIENSTDDNVGSIDATIDDVVNQVPAGSVEPLPNNEDGTDDKNKKSKKRPSKKAESKADEIQPNIFYQRTSVTEVEPKDVETSRDADPCNDVTLPIEDPKPKKQVGKRVAKSSKAAEESRESKDVDISEPEREEVTAPSQNITAAVQKSEVPDEKEAPSVSPETISRVPELPGNALETKDAKPSEDKPSGGVANSQQSAPQSKPSVPFKNKLLSGRLPSAEKAAALLSKKPLHQVDPPPLEEPKKRKIFSYQKKSAPARRLTRSNSNGKSDPKGEPAIDPYDYNEDEIVPFHEPRYKPYSPPKPVLYAPPPAKRRARKREDSPDTTTIVVQAEVHPEPPPRRRADVSALPDDKTALISIEDVPTTTSDPNQLNKRKSNSPPEKGSVDSKKPKMSTCYDGIDILDDEESGSSPPQLVAMEEPCTANRQNAVEPQKAPTPLPSLKVAHWAKIDSPLRSASPGNKDELSGKALSSSAGSTPTRVSSPMRVASPARMASPARISSPARITSPARISSPARITSPARVASPAMTSPARNPSPATMFSPGLVGSPNRLSPMHTSLPLRSYGRMSKPMSPPSEPPELVDESKVTVEEKFDADSSSPVLQPAAGPLSDLFDPEPPALERTGDLVSLSKNTSISEEDTETAVDTEEDTDSLKSFKSIKKKGKDLKMKMKKQLMRLKALKNKKKKDLKKAVGGTRKEVVKISGMAWEVSELATSPSKSEPPPPPASVLPIIKDWDAPDLWDSPIVPIAGPGPVAVTGSAPSGSPADPSPTHPSMPPLPSPSPAPRTQRSDSSGSTNIPSLGSILDSVNKLLNEPDNNFSSLPPQYSLADLQRAMGASDAEMDILEQLGEASCLTDFDESLRPVVGNAHLEDEWIMDLDNQAAQQPIVSSSVVESSPAGTPPPEVHQSLPMAPSASNSTSSNTNMFQSKFFGSDLTGLLKSSSMCKSLIRTSPKCSSSSALLAAHPHKEVVCPTCSCHFMGFPALQIHVNKVHGSQHDPTQVTGSLHNRRVVLESSRSTSRLVCFECNQILPSHLMYRHLELDHSLEPGLVSRCSTVTGDLHEGPVVGERLKSKMSNALGDLIDKAVANMLVSKNKPEATSTPQTGLSPKAMELLSRLLAGRKRDTTRINSKDQSFNKLKMSEPGPLKTDDEWIRPFSRPFLCTICGQRFPLAASRNKHEALAHKAFRNQNKMNSNDDDYYDDEDEDWRDAPSPESAFEDGGGSSLTPTCSDCGLSFDSVSDLMRHRVEDHAPRRRLSTASESGMEAAAPVSSSTAPASVVPRRISAVSRSHSLDTTSPAFDTVVDSDDSCSTAGTKSASGALPVSGTSSPVGTNSSADFSTHSENLPAPKKSRPRTSKINTTQVSKIKAEAALRLLNAPR